MTADGEDTDWTRHVVLITGSDGKGHGSGFVVRRAGAVSHVVTCAHVVTDLGPTLLADGKASKVLYDGTADGIDLAVLAVEGLTEEPLSLTRAARIGDEVLAVGFTRVDRGRRATARPAKIRESTQLTYDPQKVLKHPGWLLELAGEGITDGFSGGPVVSAETGLVIGVLGLRGAGTADAIAISNLTAWRDAPPAVSPIRDELEVLRRTAFRARAAVLVAIACLAGYIAFVQMRAPKIALDPKVVATERRDRGELVRYLREYLATIGRGPDAAAIITDDVTVRAEMGWQVSRGIYKAGDQLCVEVGGRVNVAKHESHHLTEIGKALMASWAADDTKLQDFQADLPEVTFKSGQLRIGNQKVEPFRISTTGPEGLIGARDGMFDACILRRESGWGALLVLQLPDLGYTNYVARDPVRLLFAEANLARDQIESIGARRTIAMKRSGRLAFIVNDFVLSDLSEGAICKEAYQALRDAAADLASDADHQIDRETIPLFWYADNDGEFRVQIRKLGPQDECRASSDLTLKPTDLTTVRRSPGPDTVDDLVAPPRPVDAGVPVDAKPRGRPPRATLPP